jgi:DNA-directed RNA polymerase subunit RPC12/RpoP
MKCPYCGSELLYHFAEYENDNHSLIKVYRCMRCQSNVVSTTSELTSTTVMVNAPNFEADQTLIETFLDRVKFI